MRAKRPLTRLARTLAGIFLLGSLALATPIEPDIEKLLQQPAAPPPYEPARVGWNGPEMPAAVPLPLEMNQAARARAVRRALSEVLFPDPRVLAAILSTILLLRWMRVVRERRAAARVAAPDDWQLPQAA